MSEELILLTGTAATIGLVHTLLGPDHYLPFVMMSRVQGWSTLKTAWITVICGLGHILSSAVLGSIGIAAGLAAARLESFETFRGGIATWGLIAFGGTYCVWGLRRALKGRRHSHVHLHADGTAHEHGHGHEGEHAHVHKSRSDATITPWILFTIFVFGPCELLIPMLMLPASAHSVSGIIWVTAVYGVVTLATMLCVVFLLLWSSKLLSLGRVEPYTHAIAGATLCLCGIAIQFLGL